MVSEGRTSSCPAEAADPAAERERALLEAAQGGERAAYGSIVRTYMRRAYFAALQLVGNHEDAEDISQEAFARAYRHLGDFKLERPFYPWFYRILRNLCINHLRKRSRHGPRISIDGDEETPGPPLPGSDPDPSVLAERSELVERLWREMGSLSAEHREILVLREMDELSYQEIAETLSVPIGTVMSRLHAARAALRRRMEKHLSG
jgi:RNA polymerase sigma-70 factor (ECF subfamily)